MFRNACIHVNGKKDEFYKAPCYYVLLHFSKVLTPGTRIIQSSSPDKVLIGKRSNGDYVGVIQNLTPFDVEYTFTKVQYQVSLNCIPTSNPSCLKVSYYCTITNEQL